MQAFFLFQFSKKKVFNSFYVKVILSHLDKNKTDLFVSKIIKYISAGIYLI